MKNPYYFLVSVLKYQIVSDEFAQIAATCLLTLEVIIAIFLLIGAVPRITFGICSSLFLVFALVQASALARGLQINCGCFGPVHSQEITALSLIFVVTLSLMAGLALLAATPSPVNSS